MRASLCVCKSDLPVRNYQARLYDCLMVTQITLVWCVYTCVCRSVCVCVCVCVDTAGVCVAPVCVSLCV